MESNGRVYTQQTAIMKSLSHLALVSRFLCPNECSDALIDICQWPGTCVTVA